MTRCSPPAVQSAAALLLGTAALLTACSAPAGTVAGSSAANSPVPRTSTSSRGPWGGYASRAGGFTSVSASWTVPPITCGSARSHAAAWVGVGGYGDHDLKQTGIDFDCAGGTLRLGAWYEVDPDRNPPTHWDVPVGAGDRITGSVTANPGGGFTMRLTNADKWDKTYTATDASASMLSGEVILEPGDGSPIPITTLTFGDAKANGKPFGSSTPDKLDTAGFTTGTFDAAGESFALTPG